MPTTMTDEERLAACQDRTLEIAEEIDVLEVKLTDLKREKMELIFLAVAFEWRLTGGQTAKQFTNEVFREIAQRHRIFDDGDEEEE